MCLLLGALRRPCPNPNPTPNPNPNSNPNPNLSPNPNPNPNQVTKQLRCAGVMEAVRVIAAGYPDRVPHTEVVGRFGSLVTGQASYA